MRISACKGTKITENEFEVKLTKPGKIILNLVTTEIVEQYNSLLSSEKNTQACANMADAWKRNVLIACLRGLLASPSTECGQVNIARSPS